MGLFDDFIEEKKDAKPVKKKTVKKKQEEKPAEPIEIKAKEPTILAPIEPPIEKKKRERKKNTIAASVLEGSGTGDLSDLIEQATEAEYRKKIADAELAEFKAEKEKLSLMNNAGDVMETSFGEFLYFGYIEKLHIEYVNIGKKLLPLLEGPVKENDLARVVELIEIEMGSILEETKKAQRRDVIEWRKELKR